MKRWFYILLGGLGVGLALASAFMLWLSPSLPPPYPTPVLICEYLFIAVGLGLGWMGFVNGKRAGEFDIADYIKSGRRRDHHVSGTEIRFECPMCHKGYRASPLLAGRGFTCRECQQMFTVTASQDFPQVNERRLLPEPG
jgi:hypothetical protein